MRRSHTITVTLVLMLLAPLLMAGTPARAQQATPAADCPVTPEEENTAIIQRYYDIVAAGDLDALDEVLTPVVYQHAVDVMDSQGIEEVQANLAVFTEAFADLQFDIDLWFTADEYVAARVIQSGTHVGDFVGIPATGVDSTWTIIGIWRIECGLIAEQWIEVDSISRLRQLGYLPQLVPSAPATPGVLATPAPAVTSPVGECPATTEEENEALVRRWYDEVWTQGNLDNLDELIAPDLAHHRVLNRVTTGADAREATIRQWRGAFPDQANTPDFILTNGDLVVARWIATGTHEGPWESIAPTGNEITWTGITVFRIECGRIAEEWSEADGLAFFEQMGLIEWPPADGVASPTAD
jgi:steroid delta-isomerase-like uncharacterized protein